MMTPRCEIRKPAGAAWAAHHSGLWRSQPVSLAVHPVAVHSVEPTGGRGVRRQRSARSAGCLLPARPPPPAARAAPCRPAPVCLLLQLSDVKAKIQETQGDEFQAASMNIIYQGKVGAFAGQPPPARLHEWRNAEAA